jgi:dTDP-4-dehydrorhamnose reductase
LTLLSSKMNSGGGLKKPSPPGFRKPLPAFGLAVVALGRPELDLAVPETVGPLLAAAAPDIVINAAAYTAVDQAEREPEKANAINAAGAGAVAVAARALGVPMIHLCTDYVFDGRKTTPYVEEDSVEPTSVYGVSKLAGERTIAASLSNYVILRTAWIYAPYGKNFVRNDAGAGPDPRRSPCCCRLVWLSKLCARHCGSHRNHRSQPSKRTR